MKDKRLGCLATVCIVLLIMFYWAQRDPIRIRNISWKRSSSSVLEVTFTVTNNASVGKPVSLRVQAWRERCGLASREMVGFLVSLFEVLGSARRSV